MAPLLVNVSIVPSSLTILEEEDTISLRDGIYPTPSSESLSPMRYSFGSSICHQGICRAITEWN